jgi:glucose-6-phosphate 1-dehydrogenase
MSDDFNDLKARNDALQRELEYFKNRLGIITSRENSSLMDAVEVDQNKEQSTSIVVLGASGDLAKKKTFPTLFNLYALGLLPPNTKVYGYARSVMELEEFRKHASQNFKEFKEKKEEFLQLLFYHQGQYDSQEDFAKLDAFVKVRESKKNANRLFYMAIPPSIYSDVARSIDRHWQSKTGWNRVVFEKPFGMDLDSSRKLSAELGQVFDESQIFRIDHYLGKEMVQNLMVMRFGNQVFEPLWNHHYIANVVITFKEDIGTEGRGGYFDTFGIIRDVMQNHLLQIFSIVAMEPPVTLEARDVRDEKVKVLRACSPIVPEDIITGQYTADPEGKRQGYLDDQGVPKTSKTPTYAMACIHINNARWKGVPFILKCGKALDERKTEIRIQFKRSPFPLFESLPANELVIRVQPNEAVYMKFNQKTPGLTSDITQSELDLTYKSRFETRLPDAYERLIFDVIRGDHNLFVRVDELEAAWRIFTPILHTIDQGKINPIPYPFGSRGPKEADELAKKFGFERSQGYAWAGANDKK